MPPSSIQFDGGTIANIQALYAKLHSDAEILRIFQAQDEVIGRYQKIFSLKNILVLTKDDFLSFLSFDNNKHWTNLYRQKDQITRDMDLLRRALHILVDDTQPLVQRLNQLRPSENRGMVPGLHRAIITPILLILHPDKYGVLNGTSESALKTFHLWPEIKGKNSFGEVYVKVNTILTELSHELSIDLWSLDAIWWRVKSGMDLGNLPEGGITENYPSFDSNPAITTPNQTFGLERHLQEFIVDHWNTIHAFQEWEIYSEDGEPVGVEYDTGEIGRIDILSHHKHDPCWLVVELKRDQTSDTTIGQVLRYMGWVSEHIAQPGDIVKGMIISHEADSRLSYALKLVPGVDLLLYEVEFHLSLAK